MSHLIYQLLVQLYNNEGADGESLAEYTMAIFEIEPPSGDIAETVDQLSAYLEDALQITAVRANTICNQAKNIWASAHSMTTGHSVAYGAHPHPHHSASQPTEQEHMNVYYSHVANAPARSSEYETRSTQFLPMSYPRNIVRPTSNLDSTNMTHNIPESIPQHISMPSTTDEFNSIKYTNSASTTMNSTAVPNMISYATANTNINTPEKFVLQFNTYTDITDCTNLPNNQKDSDMSANIYRSCGFTSAGEGDAPEGVLNKSSIPVSETAVQKSKFSFANSSVDDVCSTIPTPACTPTPTVEELELLIDEVLPYDDKSEADGVITDAESLLASMFPLCSAEFISEMLANANGDLDRAIAAILDHELISMEMIPESKLDAPTDITRHSGPAFTQSTIIKHSVLKASAEKKGRGVAWVQADPYVLVDETPEYVIPDSSKAVGRVCRHWLQGQCFRANCWFSHEAQDTTCRFWLKGQCIKGVHCPFTHGVSEQSWNMYKDATTTVDELHTTSVSLNTDDFPELGLADSGKRNQQGRIPPRSKGLNATVAPKPVMKPTMTQGDTQSPPNGPTSDMATTVKLNSLINAYKDVAPLEYVAERFKANRRDYKSTLAELKEVYPHVHTETQKNAASSTFIAKKKLISRNTAGKGATWSDPTHTTVGDIVWRETGKQLNIMYERTRKEAIEHGKLRGRFFQKAAEAYRRGNRQSAAALSKQGRHHHMLSTKLHRDACEAIFVNRNTRNAPEVDFHGLHVSEALELLEGLLQRASKENDYLYIITGTGRHSSQGRARLRPAVESYLEANRYYFTDVSTDQLGGMIKIQLQY
eukprot:CFRG7552T1